MPTPFSPPPPPVPIFEPATPPPPPPPSDKPPPRRVVGLSLESTVQGGDGPGFAVGNTRMGKTKKKAEEAKEIKKLPKTAAPPPPPNRVATRIPTGGSKIVRPKCKKQTLVYPDVYRERELEDTVVISVRLNARGHRRSGKVLRT